MPQHYLVAKNVIDFVFHVRPDLEKTELSVETKTDFAKPINADDASGMIKASISIEAKDIEDFNLYYSTLIIYRFDSMPEDVDQYLRNIFEKEGAAIVSDDLDALLVAMGKSPFKLKEHLVG